jgi:hypothetical protein
MTSTPEPRKDWLDHLPAEPRAGAESRVAAAVARAVAREATPWVAFVARRSGRRVDRRRGVRRRDDRCAVAVVRAPRVEAAALGELTETLAIISSVDADFFGTDD